MTPNKRNIRKLINALRSGKYHQTTDTLCEVKSGQSFHCCLGVGCRLAIKDGVEIKVGRSSNSYKVITFNNNTGHGPIELRQWLGLTQGQAGDLALMNDEDGKSFREIASFLEKEYLKQ